MVLRSQGFTIIEVSIFLAVSGLLITIALLGTGNVIQRTRFSDSGRSLNSYLQQQYDNILNGVNTRLGQEECNASQVDTNSSQAPGMSNCLFLGKLIVFKRNSSTVQTFDIVGTEPANPNYNLSDNGLIKTFTPKVVRSVGTDNFQIPWGSILSGSKRLADNKSVTDIAFIRSPRSTHIVSYMFDDSTLNGGNDLSGMLNDASNMESKTNYCISSPDIAGSLTKLTATGGQGQDALQITFDAIPGDCNGL